MTFQGLNRKNRIYNGRNPIMSRFLAQLDQTLPLEECGRLQKTPKRSESLTADKWGLLAPPPGQLA
jgi:hypothetical protein